MPVKSAPSSGATSWISGFRFSTKPRPAQGFFSTAAAAISFSGRSAALPPSISVVSTCSRVLRMRAAMWAPESVGCVDGMLVYHMTTCQEPVEIIFSAGYSRAMTQPDYDDLKIENPPRSRVGADARGYFVGSVQVRRKAGGAHLVRSVGRQPVGGARGDRLS